VTLNGELDLATVAQLDEALSERARGVTVILDLSGLTFMDSSGLRAIPGAHGRLVEANGRLVLIPGCRQVQRIFEITGVDNHLEFAPAPGLERPKSSIGMPWRAPEAPFGCLSVHGKEP
jgi:anti-sigma B factor antagonist